MAGNSHPQIAGFIIKNFLQKITVKDFEYMVTRCAQGEDKCVGAKEHPIPADIIFSLDNADFYLQLNEEILFAIADTYGYGCELLLGLYKSMIDDSDIQASPPLSPLENVKDLRTALVNCLAAESRDILPKTGLIRIKDFVNVNAKDNEEEPAYPAYRVFSQMKEAVAQVEKAAAQLQQVLKQPELRAAEMLKILGEVQQAEENGRQAESAVRQAVEQMQKDYEKIQALNLPKEAEHFRKILEIIGDLDLSLPKKEYQAQIFQAVEEFGRSQFFEKMHQLVDNGLFNE